MKKTLLVIILLFILIFCAASRYTSNPKIILLNLLVKAGAIKPGNLKYRVTFLNALPVGNATLTNPKFEDYRGQKVYFLQARAKTSAYFSKFFSAEASLESYVDRETNNPILFKQKLLVSGKPDIEKEVIYDQKNGIMTISGVGRTILPNTQDPLSIFLNLQKMDFDKISAFEMNINTNQKNYVLNAQVTPKDIILNSKTYKAYVLKAVIKRRDKNNPYHRSKITMIMLKDTENIPISIKVFASGALINARLVDIE